MCVKLNRVKLFREFLFFSSSTSTATIFVSTFFSTASISKRCDEEHIGKADALTTAEGSAKSERQKLNSFYEIAFETYDRCQFSSWLCSFCNIFALSRCSLPIECRTRPKDTQSG